MYKKSFFINTLFFLFSIFYSQLFAQCSKNTHSTNPSDMWLSCQTSLSPNPARGSGHWLLYDLGYQYELGATTFWNYNANGETGKGFKDIIIDYSLDNVNWTEAATFQLPQATGSDEYMGFVGPDLDGIAARYVLIFAQNNWEDGSCAGISELKIEVSGTVLSVAEPLVFEAIPQSDFIRLNWENNFSNGLSHFELEKSDTGSHFFKIADVEQKAVGLSFYFFNDKKVQAGAQYFYRLKKVYRDGSFDYSSIEMAELNKPMAVRIYPNPVAQVLTIQLEDWQGIEMIIQNASGHEVQRRKMNNDLNYLDVSGLPSGIYFLQLLSENGQAITKRFVKT